VDEALETGVASVSLLRSRNTFLSWGENPLSHSLTAATTNRWRRANTPLPDDESGYVTLHGRASLDAVAAAAGVPNLSEHRFRSKYCS